MRKTMPYIVAIAICAALCACNRHNTKHDFSGYFESDQVVVSSEATGRIVCLDIAEGDSVTAGEIVGAVDSLQLYLACRRLEEQLSSLRSSRPDVARQTAAIKSRLTALRREEQRLHNLYAEGAATQKQLDDMAASIVELDNQLSAQQSTLDKNVASLDGQRSALELELTAMKDNLAKCRLRSPVSGTVIAQYAHRGEFTSIGKPLFKVADLEQVYLRAYVTSGQLADIRIGTPVELHADLGGNHRRSYTGTVTWISSKSEFTPKGIMTGDERENQVYSIKIAVTNDGYIKLGMYGEGSFCKQ